MPTEPAPPPPSEPPTGARPRWRRPAVLAAALVAVGAIVAGGLRWRADRAYVGTDAPLDLTLPMCLNGIFWTDPATGVQWWAGHDLVMTGPLESEPRVLLRPADPPVRDEEGWPTTISRRAVGVIHFDSREQATFTNRVGGTLRFTRTHPDQAYKADCAGLADDSSQAPNVQVGSADGTYGTLTGTVSRSTGAGPPPEVVAGSVRVMDGAAVVAESAPRSQGFSFWLPPGTYTVERTSPGPPCRTKPGTLGVGEHLVADLVCLD